MRRRRRPTLHHAVKDKRVTVLGPVKQPEMDFISHRGEVLGRGGFRGGNFAVKKIGEICPLAELSRACDQQLRCEFRCA